MRTLGKLMGACFGSLAARAPKTLRRYLGLGTVSQASVAIGLSLVVSHKFTGLGPDIAEILNLMNKNDLFTSACIARSTTSRKKVGFPDDLLSDQVDRARNLSFV